MPSCWHSSSWSKYCQGVAVLWVAPEISSERSSEISSGIHPFAYKPAWRIAALNACKIFGTHRCKDGAGLGQQSHFDSIIYIQCRSTSSSRKLRCSASDYDSNPVKQSWKDISSSSLSLYSGCGVNAVCDLRCSGDIGSTAVWAQAHRR